MKNSVMAHQEALISCICDVQAPLEANNIRCKIMVMSALCFATLLKEDHSSEKDPLVKFASTENLTKSGYIGMMFGSVIYIDRDRKS